MSADPSNLVSAFSTGCAGALEATAGCGDAASKGEVAKKPRADDLCAGCTQAVVVSGDSTKPQTRPTTLRDFEHALRTLGFSARESKAIARDGFKVRQSPPEPDELESVRQAVLSRASLLKRQGIV